MADFEIIEEVGKALPKGKDLKKMTPFIIGGLGLGVVALFMKKKDPQTDPQTDPNIMADDGVGSGVDLGGIMSDFANQTNQAIQQNNQEMNYKLSGITENLLGVIQDQNSYLNDFRADQNNVISQLRSDFNDQLNSIERSSGSSGGSSYQRVASVQSKRIDDDDYSSGSSIYFDDVDDDIQYNNVVKNVKDLISSGKLTQAKGNEIKKQIAGTGNDGIGWTPENWVDNAKRLSSDPTYKQSEIERTVSVMENRQASGMTTERQVKYLDSLTKLK